MPSGSEGYSDRPLVAGTIIGHKWLMTDGEGYLYGPSYPQEMQSGENVAGCIDVNGYGGPVNAFTTYAPEGKYDRPLRLHQQEDDHRVPDIHCGCGFWAYTLHGVGESMSYPNGNALLCAVEGYGRCIVGPRGFRAEKMRLLGVAPPAHRAWSLARLANRRSPWGVDMKLWDPIVDRVAERYGIERFTSQRALEEKYPLDHRPPDPDRMDSIVIENSTIVIRAASGRILWEGPVTASPWTGGATATPFGVVTHGPQQVQPAPEPEDP